MIWDTKANSLFLEAMELEPGPTRRAFLDRTCAGDAGLRARVESLLGASAAAGTFLEFPASGVPEAPTLEPAAPALDYSGAAVGPYRLLERIGEGGFGVVYLAEQREPVQRRVAFKVIKLGMDTRQVIARFETERQALAMMDHPNIARVLDAGATEAGSPFGPGRPYFVMELVKGEPITAYCDDRCLAARERLELFTDVCHAVQHAHQKGVIHRDLKPSNVMVSRYDDRPVVKIIDFGIAKATAGPLTDRTLFTGLHQLIGTPAYMSPEQAGLSDLDIDTRSDIYSLGVLLYELLTGTTPFDADRLRTADFDEMRRIIREEEPPRPSTRVSALRAQHDGAGANGPGPAVGSTTPDATGEPAHHSSALEIARCRHTDPQSLARLLHGELDWIVMKCLEKDRTRRYETANALATDIGHYLASEPVVAAPPSRAYRVRKFVRRNRRLVAAASIIAAVLVLATVGTSLVTAWALRERARATSAATTAQLAESRAEGEARRARLAEVEQGRLAKAEEAQRRNAEAITEFVTRALVSSSPDAGGAQGFLVTDAMEQAVALLDSGALKDQPETEAELLLTICDVLNGNGRSEEALLLAKRALQISRGLHTGDSHAVAAALSDAGTCLTSLGRYSEALASYQEATEMYGRLYPDGHAYLATSIENVGTSLERLGRSAEALPVLEWALDMRQRLYSGDNEDLAHSLHNVGGCLASLGRPAEALAKQEAALQMRRRLYAGDHPEIAVTLNNIGACLAEQLSRFADALPYFEEALAMYQRLYGGDHPDVALALNNVAFCLGGLGRQAEALPKLEASLEMRRRLFPGDHPGVATSLNNVAMSLLSLGRPAEALPDFEETLEMRRRLFDGDHPLVALSLNNLGGCLEKLGRPAEALPKFEAGAEMYARLDQGDHPVVALNLSNVGRCLKSLGRTGEAVPRFEASLAMYERLQPNGHERVAYNRHHLAECVRDLGDFDRAELLAQGAVDWYREHPRDSLAPEYEHAVNVLGETLAAAGKPDEAVAIRHQFIEHCRQLWPADRTRIANALATLAGLLLEQERYAEAEPVLRECLAIREETLPEDDWRRANTMSMLGGALLGQADELLEIDSELAVGLLAEAAPLVVRGGEGVLAGTEQIPAASRANRIRQAIERAVRLYEARDAVAPGEGYDTKAAEWRAKLESAAAAVQTDEPGPPP